MSVSIKYVNNYVTTTQKLFKKTKNNSFKNSDSFVGMKKNKESISGFHSNTFLSHQIDPEEIKRQKEIATKMEPIIKKLNSGQKLTSEEKEFLRQNNPALYDKVVKIEEECEKYRRELNACKSEEEANRLHTLKMVSSLSGGVKNMDVFMKKALEEEYKAWEEGEERSGDDII